LSVTKWGIKDVNFEGDEEKVWWEEGWWGAEDLPLCALSDDRVVEIQGEARLVQRAMEMVVSHLRKFLVDRSVLTLFELNVGLMSMLMLCPLICIML
jgi:hypothetical protein